MHRFLHIISENNHFENTGDNESSDEYGEESSWKDDSESDENSNAESGYKQQISQPLSLKPTKSLLKEKTHQTEKMEGRQMAVKSVRWKDDITEREAAISSENESEVDSFCDDASDSEGNFSMDKKQVLKEDIYGRVHDESGKLVRDSNSRMPSALRVDLSSIDDKQKLKLERLKRQLKGLVNR